MSPGRARLIAWLVGLAVLAVLAMGTRRGFVRSFFPDGVPGPAPALSRPAHDAPGLEPVDHVRVLLIDGLGYDEAFGLPNLDRLCDRGLDLEVDNGFPTVSLPIQHVLWTGRTQPQSGVMYRVLGLHDPPADAIPARVPGSAAAAESHIGIVESFGFSEVRPRMEDDAGDLDDLAGPWRLTGFTRAAQEVVRSNAPLAFVHVLRVDELGHAQGADSDAYRGAARWADTLAGALFDASTVGSGSWRWIVLSDHGHRPGGGHGGAEPGIRRVRGCVIGGLPAQLPTGRSLHLVDLSRVIADSLGLAPAADAVGRPLAYALDHPDPDATLPVASVGRQVVAGLVLLLALAATWWGGGGRPGLLPWWLVVAYGTVVTSHGPVTLSNPMVYPPLGRDMILAAVPGLVVLAFVAWRERGRAGLPRLAIAQLGLAIGACVAALVLCGAVSGVLGLHDGPPLVPLATAHASLFFSLTAAGAGVLAVVSAARLFASGATAEPGTSAGTSPRAP